METSREVFDYLDQHHRKTGRDMEDKKGRGTYLRVYHYAEYNEIPPLAKLAEIKTLEDENRKPCTEVSHFWLETRQLDEIMCREYACLTCAKCSVLKFRHCELGWKRVGVLHTCLIRREHGGREEPRVTIATALEQAATVKEGDLIGAECANTTEPYIVARVTKALHKLGQVFKCPWMGTYEPNTPLLNCVKYEKRNSDGMYAEMHKRSFTLAAEDLRIVFKEHTEVQPQRASGRNAQARVPIVKLSRCELDTLRLRVHIASEL